MDEFQHVVSQILFKGLVRQGYQKTKADLDNANVWAMSDLNTPLLRTCPAWNSMKALLNLAIRFPSFLPGTGS